jgi:DNA-binding CsgD family transcriptional regulator
MARLSKNQAMSRTRILDAAASLLPPRPLAKRLMDALSLAIPSDGYRFFQIDPRTLLINRLLDASENDLDPRNEWLGEVYLRSGALSYIELPEQMRAGLTSVVLQEEQAHSFGLKRSMLESVSARAHYDLYHELRSPIGGTIFGTFQSHGLWMAAMQAYRRDSSPAFRPTDVEFLRSVNGIIGDAIAASLGRERAMLVQHPAPGASGLLIIAASDRIRPLTSASEQWLDLLNDSRESALSSAVMSARAALLANPEAVRGQLIAPTSVGQVRIEASRSDDHGGVAIVIATAGLPDPMHIPPDWALTAREREIALLTVQGLETTEIASRCFLSIATVNWHLANIYEKVHVNGRSGLVARFFMDVVYPGVSPLG